MRLSSLHLACATSVLVAIAAVPVAPQQRQMGGIGITVYEQPNFRGRNATYRDDVRNLNDTGMNDRINSLEVAPGEMWEVCEDRDFRGRCQVFSGTEYDLRARGWGDQISSLRRVRGGGGGGGGDWSGGGGGGARGLALYAGRNFTGDVRWFQGPVSNLRQVGFDNTAMSLRLPEGEVWEVCDEAFFRQCRQVNTAWPDLARLGMSRRISSVRPWSQGGGGWGGGGGGGWGGGGRRGIVLFDARSYRGQSVTLDEDTPLLGGFSNRAESVQVLGGAWELCDRPRFQGRCVTVDSNQYDLGSLGMRSRVASARPVGR